MLQIIKSRLCSHPDFIGIAASVLCMIHCLFVPITLTIGYWWKTTKGYEITSPKVDTLMPEQVPPTHRTVRYYGLKYQKSMAENHADHLHLSAGELVEQHLSHGNHTTFWHALDYFFVFIALLAVHQSSQKTASKSIKLLLWSAFSVFGLSVLLHEAYPWLLYLSLSASLLLVYGHYLRWKVGRKCIKNPI
ncbi:MAG: MerC family mercury resistance protein [Nitritalea sp.]